MNNSQVNESRDRNPSRSEATLVSIIIPCYNYAHFLSEAIDSALRQTYPNIEILVIDDGSRDATANIAARYRNQVQYFYKSNGGLSQARNYGVRQCNGQYIVFLDADDLLEPTFIEECLEILLANPKFAFVYTQLRYFGNVEQITNHPDYDVERLKLGNYINACALLKKDLVCRHPYDESNRTSWEDWDFYLTLASQGYYGILLNKPLVRYRRHGESMTSKLEPVIKQKLRVSILGRHIRLVGLKMYLKQYWKLHRLQMSYKIRGAIHQLGWS